MFSDFHVKNSQNNIVNLKMQEKFLLIAAWSFSSCGFVCCDANTEVLEGKRVSLLPVDLLQGLLCQGLDFYCGRFRKLRATGL